MRVLKSIDVSNRLFAIETNKKELTRRLSDYGVVHNFWIIRGSIIQRNGVFSIIVALTLTANEKRVCEHLDLRLEQ